MKRAITAILSASVVLASWTSVADAQEQKWLADRKYREGMGYRIGDFELHPGLGATFGYDSNYFHRAESDIGGAPVAAMRLRVSPSLSLSTLGAQRRGDGPPPSIGFRTELMATYNEFFAVSGTDTDKQRMSDQRDVAGRFNLGFDIFPGREWSAKLNGGVSRAIRPTQSGSTAGSSSFNRWLPTGTGRLTWRPGSGLLDWDLGYEFQGRFFEDASLGGLDRQVHNISTRGRWRFYPRTALIYEGEVGFVSYPTAGAGVTLKGDSNPVRSRFGLNGLITPSFSILALAGWGASFYSAPQGSIASPASTVEDFDSFIGQLELKWYLGRQPRSNPLAVSGALSAISVGFERDFQDAYFGSYNERNRGYLRFSYLFGGAFLMSLEGGGSAVVFPAQQNTADIEYSTPGGWTDARIDAKLFAEYRVKDSVGINAEVGFDGYFSETTVTFTDQATSTRFTDPIAYKQVTAFLGLRWFM
jgi:hypothetical protein